MFAVCSAVPCLVLAAATRLWPRSASTPASQMRPRTRQISSRTPPPSAPPSPGSMAWSRSCEPALSPPLLISPSPPLALLIPTPRPFSLYPHPFSLSLPPCMRADPIDMWSLSLALPVPHGWVGGCRCRGFQVCRSRPARAPMIRPSRPGGHGNPYAQAWYTHAWYTTMPLQKENEASLPPLALAGRREAVHNGSRFV